MLNVLLAFAGMGVLGVVFGLILAVVSKKFAVEIDPKVEEIIAALPGVNCGVCGAPGCAGYAAAVARGAMAPNCCVPGGSATAKRVAAIMGLTVTELEAQLANVICQGFDPVATDRVEWQGITTCAMAARTGGGPRACRFGCIGFGDCAGVCPFGAIDLVDRRPLINPKRCTGCGKCMVACPKGVIVLRPKDRPVHILCRTGDPAKLSRSLCKLSCIKCKICVKSCPQQAITWMTDPLAMQQLWAGGKYPAAALERLRDLPVIDYAKCNDCGTCARKCPQHTIIDRRAAAASVPPQP